MSDVNVTVVGHVGTNPVLSMSENGTEWSTFRMASTRRVRDPLTGQWADGATLWFTVKTWRDKARNVAHSLRKGDPVIVTGRLVVDEWTSDRELALPDGTTTTVPEQRYKLVVEAQHVGPDATRGVARYAPVIDRAPATARGAEGGPGAQADDPWSTGAPPTTAPPAVPPADGMPGVEQEEPGDLEGELSDLLEDTHVRA